MKKLKRPNPQVLDRINTIREYYAQFHPISSLIYERFDEEENGEDYSIIQGYEDTFNELIDNSCIFSDKDLLVKFTELIRDRQSIKEYFWKVIEDIQAGKIQYRKIVEYVLGYPTMSWSWDSMTFEIDNEFDTHSLRTEATNLKTEDINYLKSLIEFVESHDHFNDLQETWEFYIRLIFFSETVEIVESFDTKTYLENLMEN